MRIEWQYNCWTGEYSMMIGKAQVTRTDFPGSNSPPLYRARYPRSTDDPQWPDDYRSGTMETMQAIRRWIAEQERR
jgi:hypothetical protein